MPAADTHAADSAGSRLTIPASTLMHSSVCPRASERKSGGIFFRGNYLRGGPTPLLLAQPAPAPGMADNHPNNLTQKARTLLMEDAGALDGLIAAGISLAIIAIVNTLGGTLNTKFTSINTSLK